MSNITFIYMTALLAVSVIISRFLPFLLFGHLKKTPAFIEYLGKVLPAAMMGLLVVYCFKDLDVTQAGELIPAAAAALSVVLIHLWRKNYILSIAAGTAVYMILIRII